MQLSEVLKGKIYSMKWGIFAKSVQFIVEVVLRNGRRNG